MTPRLFVRLAVPAVVILSGALVVIGGKMLGAESRDGAIVRADEVRVRQHLQRVENELRGRDVSALSAVQRAARARNIEVLHAYLTAAIFPHNHDRPAERLPFFRDEHGTLCAVGYLMQQSGRGDLVDRIAGADNNVYVRELASDAEVGAWLAANGLTLEEAARIQPSYGGIDGEARPSAGYAVATALLAATDGGIVVFNLMSKDKSYAPGIFAMIGGAVTALTGLAGLQGDNVDLAGINTGLGAVTLTTGFVRTIVVANARGKKDAPAGQAPQREPNWSPLLSTDLDGRTRVGLSRRF